MSTAQFAGQSKGTSAPSSSLFSLVVRLLLLSGIDASAIWFTLNLTASGDYILAVAIILVTTFANVVIFRKDAYPLRWMLAGLVLMVMFAIYPILYTVYVAFTNFGDGHLLSKQQAITQIEKERFLPEGAGSYTWTAFTSDSGQFALWLLLEGEPGLLASPGQPIEAVAPGERGVGQLDADGIPEKIQGYERLDRLTVVRHINELGELSFGTDDRIVQVTTLDRAAELLPRFKYDPDQDVIVDQQNGDIYVSEAGTFIAPGGRRLVPGFQAVVGTLNFGRFFTSPALKGPLVRIIIWNFAFAFLSVFMTFALGLAIAHTFNDRSFIGKKVVQTLLLVPYTIPSLITILIWRGLLNPEIGVVNRTIESLIGTSPAWFSNPWWAKVGVLLVNLWLGYPYFMLISSGALQAIPTDIYEAARVDGATAWQRFRAITLPLLLVAVGPLLVASFTFNFNNFNLIFLFIGGGPPIAGASTQAGHTDILISYVYNLAFAGGRGADYGLAAAITIVIFLIVAAITLFQFRYTRMWEEVSESV